MNESLLSLIKNSFGFDPTESCHHFVVDIPRSGDAPIKISEHLTWDDEKGSSEVTSGAAQDGQIRVLLARSKWDTVADELRAQFNQRLKKLGKKSGSWHAGPNLVRRELGKELVLLAWAIEEADPALIPHACQLERAGARRTLVAVYPDRCRHRARHQRPRARLA